MPNKCENKFLFPPKVSTHKTFSTPNFYSNCEVMILVFIVCPSKKSCPFPKCPHTPTLIDYNLHHFIPDAFKSSTL